MPASEFAQQKQNSCSRDTLNKVVDLRIATQTKGYRSGLSFVPGFSYKENVTNFNKSSALSPAVKIVSLTSDNRRLFGFRPKTS